MGRWLLAAAVWLVAWGVSSPAWAGFDEALAAYKAKNYQQAFQEAQSAAERGDARSSYLLGIMYQSGQGVAADPAKALEDFERAAQGGVAGAYAKLAQAYARGAGVAKDRDKALAYARQGARLGDPDGAFFLSMLLTNEYLSYLGANGKPDEQKYAQLAGRPVAERTLDTEARDALYWSADKGHPMAMVTLAMTYGASLGDGNRKRMQALLEKLRGVNLPALKNYQQLARHMDSLGDSYATPQLFMDSQLSQMVAAMIKTCGIRDPKAEDRPPPPKLVGIRIAKPLANAIYLPSKLPGYEKSYLIAGDWEEEWTYEGCGRQAAVTVKFAADGLGGARMRSEQSGKDIPGLPDAAGKSGL